MRAWFLMLGAMSASACGTNGTNTLPVIHGPTDAASDSGAGSGNPAGDAASSPLPTSDAGLAAGDPCDPQNDQCPTGTKCCPVSGNVREGGALSACLTPKGSPPACP